MDNKINYSSLFNKIRYTAPYDFLINYNILEFDLEKANISALYKEQFFTKEEYEYYYNLSKKDREIAVGKLIRKDSNIYKIIQKGIINAKELFFKENKIYTENILYIDNDSVTLIYPIKIQKQFITKFLDIYNFKCKNIYTSFLKIFGIDLLYFNNGNTEYFRLKNCNQEFLKKNHTNGFLDILLTILYSGQFDTLENTIILISNIYKQYVQNNLPINYYKEFNNFSKYKIISKSKTATYYIDNDELNQYLLKDINISYNATILQLLYRYFIKQYFQKVK